MNKNRSLNVFVLSCFTLLILPLLFIQTGCGGKSGKGDSVRPHVLLITIDTLRRDHLSCYGYPRQTSPFIDSLAEKGMRFEHAVTPMPATSPSHATVLTSLHPLSHSLTSNAAPLHENVKTVAEIYKKNGYHTIGAVSVKILSKEYQFDQGFHSFSDNWKKGDAGNLQFERTAESTNKSLFEQIDKYTANQKGKTNKPLFIWVHYFDPHWPYREHKDISFKYKRQERDDNKHILHYDQEIRYTDRHIEALYKYMENKGLTEPLVTCITADHGEQFFEHGASYCHQDIYSENILVPLILHGHNIPEGVAVNDMVSTMDIGATLLAQSKLTFGCRVDGGNLMDRYHPDVKEKDKFRARQFLVMGYPNSTRSLQFAGLPYSYILNFDHHYKYWYVSGQPVKPLDNIDEKKFKHFKEKQIRGNDKKIELRFPHVLKRHLNYMIIRADIENNKGLSAAIKIYPALHTQKVTINKKSKQLNIIYPVTTLDRIILYIDKEKETKLKNIRFTVIKAKDLTDLEKIDGKLENKIFTEIKTPRKNQTNDEFYNLTTDIKMTNNLINEKKHKRTIIEYKKRIYKTFRLFYKKGKAIRKGKPIRGMTEKDKKILKSLGYL